MVVLNQKDRLFGHISLGSSNQIGCEYQFRWQKSKIRTISSVELSSENIRCKQECDLVYHIDEGCKFMGQLVVQSQFRRIRLDLVRRISDSLKTFVQIDNVNSNNLVLYLGLKYRKTDFMFPVYWNQKGHVLQKGNWKVLAILAVSVSLFENLQKTYRRRFKEEKDKEKKKEKYDDKMISLSIKLKQIERRAMENHNQQKMQNGLVILEAYYGCKEILKELEKQENKNQYLYRTRLMRSNRLQDITMALRFWIYKGRLELLESSKEYLYGVGDGLDPMIQEKGILIRYVYQDREYQELYEDSQKISIPGLV